MNPLSMGIVAGCLGTLLMDGMNLLISRTGILIQIDVRMIGRASYGWARGRVFYSHPSHMPEVPGELVYGYCAHYLIGTVLATAYFFGWDLIGGGPPSPVWAVVYGIATTLLAYFFLLPSIGWGICGSRSPHGIRLPLSTLANHLFYGIGIAAAIALS